MENNVEIKKVKSQPKSNYMSFEKRIIIYGILFLVCFLGCLIAAKYSFEYKNAEEIDYSESQSVDYQVYLKENDFYEEKYLGKNMLYVASLIDKINIDLNYNFRIARNINMAYDYKVVGNLVIKDGNNKNTFFTKEYILKDLKQGQMVENAFDISENVEIDYNYYNSLANNFKTQYGVDTTSYLEVSLVVSKNSGKDVVDINDTNNVTLSIPLSEKAIEINFKSQDASVMKKAIVDRKLEFNSIVFLVEIVLLIISIILIKNLISLLVLLPGKKSNYDSYLEKILKEYDRLIVETSTGIDEKRNHVIYVQKFEELLDVRDTLKVPIMYYNIVKHQKSYFYVKNNNDVYMLKLKAIDMDEENNSKK